jgi:hypothetical protein
MKSLEERRIIKDQIMVFKIYNKLVDLEFDQFFELSNEHRTRGHCLKLFPHRSRLDVRKHFFTNRVIAVWNQLPESVVSSSSLAGFKSRINSVDLSSFLKGRAM